eukprot:11321-Eustigmatos_ZCMA.PRE.1
MDSPSRARPDRVRQGVRREDCTDRTERQGRADRAGRRRDGRLAQQSRPLAQPCSLRPRSRREGRGPQGAHDLGRDPRRHRHRSGASQY